MDLLFARLSPELRTFAIKKVGRFLATTSLPSMSAEASVLAQAAATSDAEAAAQHILEPILAQIDAELPGLQHLPSGQLSKVGIRNTSLSIFEWRYLSLIPFGPEKLVRFNS